MKVNLVFLLLFILLLAHLQGRHAGVGSVLLLLHLHFQIGHIATPLAGNEEKSKIEKNLDPEAEAVWKQTCTQEDEDWMDDFDDEARSNDQVDQWFPCIQFLPDLFTKERERRQSLEEAIKSIVKI